MIYLGSRVKHASSGQQGVTNGRAYARGKETRWYVRWDNPEHGTPDCVVESELIEIRPPRERPTLDQLKYGK